MALAANVVERNRNILRHLFLHAEVPEYELRRTASQIRIGKSDAGSRTAEASRRSVARGIGLARADILAGAQRLADSADGRDAWHRVTRTTGVGILERDRGVIIHPE